MRSKAHSCDLPEQNGSSRLLSLKSRGCSCNSDTELPVSTLEVILRELKAENTAGGWK